MPAVPWDAVLEVGKEVGKIFLKEAGKAAVNVAVTKGAEAVLEEDNQTQTFDKNAADRKAALQAASATRKRIAGQTQTLLTSPLGVANRAVAGVSKTLLGQ